MQRSLCFKSPMFSETLSKGAVLMYERKNRKGDTLLKARVVVKSNFKTQLLVRVEGAEEILNDTLFIDAKDVYHGKDRLELVGYYVKQKAIE